MSTLEQLLYEFEALKDSLDTDPQTLDICIKLTESYIPKIKWDMDRSYDHGWMECLKFNKQ
jgi:hypothetical protein